MTKHKTSRSGTGQINPLAMSLAQAARILSAVGVGKVTEGVLRKHIAGGAPTNPDGSVSIVDYGAWLNQQMNRQDHDGTGL